MPGAAPDDFVNARVLGYFEHGSRNEFHGTVDPTSRLDSPVSSLVHGTETPRAWETGLCSHHARPRAQARAERGVREKFWTLIFKLSTFQKYVTKDAIDDEVSDARNDVLERLLLKRHRNPWFESFSHIFPLRGVQPCVEFELCG